MVTRPFSSVIGMLPIGEFENRFFISWANVDAKIFWAPLIDNPFSGGFGPKFQYFFQLN